MDLRQYFVNEGWRIVGQFKRPGRDGDYYDFGDLPVGEGVKCLLGKMAPGGLFRHQKQAILRLLEGAHVIVTTGTASGKSLIFQAAAAQLLESRPAARVLALYPLKALGKEQEERWRAALRAAHLDAPVGRIDGQVAMNRRMAILDQCRVVIMTPDVLHAWFMANLGQPVVTRFIRSLSLVVIDEVHNYTGVFGSNAAFLFRRLRHAASLLACSPLFVAASATIRDPKEHLEKLVGLPFEIVSAEHDTSPRHDLDIFLVDPPARDLLTTTTDLMSHVARQGDDRFLAFVDSRKQTEHMASILSRSSLQDEEERNIPHERLQQLDILPYRAGYEEEDAALIQARLAHGKLTGVVSTSALELGIDIPYLTLGILVGVPRSGTSLQQRIGRIGRQSAGTIVVINTGDVYNNTVFRTPERLFEVPPAEGALYLENPRIQYIHTLCLARQGGEHDRLAAGASSGDDPELHTPIDWPPGFLDLCKVERAGVIAGDLQSMKAQAGDDPNHAFPLRDVEVQFKVEEKHGPLMRSLGSLSYAQLLREAYPGAVYYYATQPYRVFRVKSFARVVEVRPERRYTTKPTFLPTMVFPNLTAGHVYRAIAHGDLVLIECDLQIRVSISGFRERRGSSDFVVAYPLDAAMGLYFDQPRFTRNYFTTGVVLAHPMLNELNSDQLAVACANLFEAFLMVIPFERRDIDAAYDRVRLETSLVPKGHRFICLYDQTYGSLRLSSRLLEDGVVDAVLRSVLEIEQPDESRGDGAVAVWRAMGECLKQPPRDVRFVEGRTDADATTGDATRVRVIVPGSVGINLARDGEEFVIDHVFFNPRTGTLSYRGRNASERDNSELSTVIPVDRVVEIPGESKVGLYDLETGEVCLFE